MKTLEESDQTTSSCLSEHEHFRGEASMIEIDRIDSYKTAYRLVVVPIEMSPNGKQMIEIK